MSSPLNLPGYLDYKHTPLPLPFKLQYLENKVHIYYDISYNVLRLANLKVVHLMILYNMILYMILYIMILYFKPEKLISRIQYTDNTVFSLNTQKKIIHSSINTQINLF